MKLGKKGPLIFATIVAFFSVCTAGVSTFAWFQATANVNIQTATDSASITVTKPDDVTCEFYAYTGNTAKGYTPTNVARETASATELTFTGAFGTKLEGAAQTIAAGSLIPGNCLTYCIKITTAGTHSASITSFTETKNANRLVYSSGTTTTQVALGWAMKIYYWSVTSITDESASLSGLYDYINVGTNRSGNVFDYAYGTAAKDSYSIGSGIKTTNNIYLFYTIEFDNTTYSSYQHVDSSGNPVYVSSTGTTYWSKSDSGTSEAYEGLGFNITGITII